MIKLELIENHELIETKGTKVTIVADLMYLICKVLENLCDDYEESLKVIDVIHDGVKHVLSKQHDELKKGN